MSECIYALSEATPSGNAVKQNEPLRTLAETKHSWMAGGQKKVILYDGIKVVSAGKITGNSKAMQAKAGKLDGSANERYETLVHGVSWNPACCRQCPQNRTATGLVRHNPMMLQNNGIMGIVKINEQKLKINSVA